MKIEGVADRCRDILAALAEVIVGKTAVLEQILAGVLANGHILIEDYPGLAKTLIARLVGKVRRSIDGDPLSVLDTPPPAPRGPALDERFLRLRDDLVFSSGSQHYFGVFLQPRLRALGGGEVPARPGRRRRGPSLRTLERLIAEIEQRP